MEKVFALVMSKIKLVLGEALNLLTNLLVPAVDVLLAVAAVIPGMPKQVLVALHKVEAALEKAGTTLEDVEAEIKRFTK
jgi:phage-related minor tail protein